MYAMQSAFLFFHGFAWFCMATDKHRKTSTWAFGVAPMCAHLAIELVTCKATMDFAVSIHCSNLRQVLIF